MGQWMRQDSGQGEGTTGDKARQDVDMFYFERHDTGTGRRRETGLGQDSDWSFLLSHALPFLPIGILTHTHLWRTLHGMREGIDMT